MIVIKGIPYKTIVDMARELDVSAKTVRYYIKRGIVPEPPTIRQGLRVIKYFPDEYIEEVLADIITCANHGTAKTTWMV